MALKYVMINDIIEEHNARMQNLRKYYPFFVLAETTFAQYKEGRYAHGLYNHGDSAFFYSGEQLQ